ncbi:hypothetical protein [Streptomyces sp. NPDC005438]|uniref:hypothetical protein n=1 Tax=Streptomyces sp. NPDC005438 TaxID=3156880 RepID=UPI0033A76638
MEASPRHNEEAAVEHRGSTQRLGDSVATDPPEDREDGDPLSASPVSPQGGPAEAGDTPVEPHELRPPRRLRPWQLAPIVGLAALGSLMFAFPLAFEPGGGSGAVVAMLGLLLCGCAAGWGLMAASRAGLRWPGLNRREAEQRPDWRVVVVYALVVTALVALAIWRVAILR